MIKIGIIAGEPSGDLLGGQLIAQIQKVIPHCVIEGIAGPKLMEQGCIQLFSIDELSVMGLWEPLKKLPQILALRRKIIKYFLQNPPDIFIGIDAPDFNLGIEKVLHKAGITTVHFVSPSVWAWRQNRVHFIKKYVNLMLALFPFETKFYQQHDVPVVCTGHPQADEIPLIPADNQAVRQTLQLNVADKILAILPGSRKSEIKYMGPVYLQAMQLINKDSNFSDVKFVMPVVNTEHKEIILKLKAKYCPQVELLIVVGNSRLVMQACDYALVTSGTATLELMLHKKPMVVAYKSHWLTYKIIKALVKVKYAALPNLLANQEIAENIADNLLALISAKEKMQLQRDCFLQLHKSIKLDAVNVATKEICDLLLPSHSSGDI
jgi:lipid-A-disaccharide synthase